MGHKKDIGMLWAKLLNIYGQFGSIQGLVNTSILIIMFYTGTIRQETGMPPWLYALILLALISTGVAFIHKKGISGYYRFFSEQSGLDEVKADIKKIKEALNIED